MTTNSAASTNANQISKTVNKTVDHREARLMRDTMQFERQRNLDDHNIIRIASEMKRGRFTPDMQIYIAVYPDGGMAILNGNHTLEAICLCGIAQPLAITYRPVADIEEAARIYCAFDNQKIRTIKDSIKAGGHDTGFVNLSTGKKDDGAVGSALRIILQGWAQGQGRQYQIANRLDINDMVPLYHDACVNLSEVIDGCREEQRKLIKSAPIMAVALETMRWQVDLARVFWGNFAQDNGLYRGMPEKTLIDSLRISPNSKPLATSTKVKLCAIAWNAKTKDQIRFMYQPARFTFKLLGTPYAKGIIEND